MEAEKERDWNWEGVGEEELGGEESGEREGREEGAVEEVVETSCNTVVICTLRQGP